MAGQVLPIRVALCESPCRHVLLSKRLARRGKDRTSITSTFIATAFANDAEPNDSAAAAIAWGLNGVSTGHLGFYGNNYTDLADWRKVTTAQDGKLVIAIYSDATIEIDNYIYDADRTTQLAGYKHGGAHREDTSECPRSS